MSGKNNGRRYIIALLALYFLLLGGGVFSCYFGRYPIHAEQILKMLLNKLLMTNSTPGWDIRTENVFFSVRLPRVLLAIMVGGALAVSGASYQVLFKNPMVSPGILGVSAGAGFGAALAMVCEASWWQIQLSAFCFGIGAVALALLIAWSFGRRETTVMILGGVVVSSFFGALLSVVKTLADTENALPSIVFWLMGSLDRSSRDDVLLMLPSLAAALGLLFVLRYPINALAAGEQEASTLGVNVWLVKSVVILAATLMTVVAVCACGIVGWVGMIVPHLARMLVGASYARVLAISFALGGLFLLTVDSLIRALPSLELPPGVLTALVGTPVFVLLLHRTRRGWH
jgi:iron complex transport system permease protein